MKRILLALVLAVAGANCATAQDVTQRVGICDPTPYSAHYCAKPDSSGNIPVTGTFSATLAGFTPNGNVANLSVSTASANVALPAGPVVAVLNSGSTDASIKLSVGAGSAATTDFVLKSGATVGLTVGSNTYINAITASGSTTLSVAGGAGLVTGYGGGGASSGGGDASAANQTVVQAVIGAATAPTKMNAAGGVYNSTPLTLTNGQSSALQLDANGYVNVDIKTGSSSGAVAQGSTTSGQTVVPMGCRTLTSAPTDTTAQTNMPSCDVNGALRVNVTSATGVAQGSTTSGQSASPIGCRTLSATPTDTTAQTNIPVCNIRGNLVVSPYTLPDNLVNGTTAAMTGTTSTSLLAAPGAGLYNYITQISCVNSHATVGTFVTVQDGSGGTALMTLAAASLFGGDNKTFPAPFKQTTSNTALFVADVTTGANVICSASGYKGP